MENFTQIPLDTFNQLQVDAGIVTKNFDPAKPSDITQNDILFPTTGGINPTCIPTYSDIGEDVDNAPVNTKELKRLDGWDCKMAFTSLGVTKESVRLSLGAADIEANSGKIAPRRKLKQEDFDDAIWWVGDLSDGGFAAVKLENVLSTGGFSLQTTKAGKGQLSIELTGHVSIKTLDKVPMEFYVINAPVGG